MSVIFDDVICKHYTQAKNKFVRLINHCLKVGRKLVHFNVTW